MEISFEFTAGRVGGPTKSGGVANETLQNHHPSLRSLPVVSSRHKPPHHPKLLRFQIRIPCLSWHRILHCFQRAPVAASMGESIARIKPGCSATEAAASGASVVRMLAAPCPQCPEGARSRNLGGHQGLCPCSRVVGTVPEGADATTSPSLSRFTGAS